jgi:hypothetical protein
MKSKTSATDDDEDGAMSFQLSPWDRQRKVLSSVEKQL